MNTPVSKVFQEAWQLPDNPFPYLGADNYPEEQVLSLFELDRTKTMQAFSIQNSIIEGSYGTGKTMLLKAIYSFYYSKMIVDITERHKCDVIPVYVKLSDLPHDPEDIYREIIVHIYKRILDTRFEVAKFTSDTRWFGKFQTWLARLTNSGVFKNDQRYSELTAETVTSKVRNVFKGEATFGAKWLKSLTMAYENEFEKIILSKPKPGIIDIEELFRHYFSSICEKLLILVDEVDNLPKDFYEKKGPGQYSQYETLFNQFRTNRFIAFK